jgi:hypothetical protein
MDAVKRVTLIVVAVALLALPAGADAGAFFKGPVNGGANNAGVEFRVKFHHGDPRKLLEFRWFNVPVPPQCYDSFEGTRFAMKVHATGRFRGDYDVPNTDHVAKVRGRFKHGGKKAVGRLELEGSFAGGCVSADTGWLHWVARRPNG